MTDSHDAVGTDLKTLLQEAFALHQQGQIQQAQLRYQRILQADPLHFNALHLLGVSLLQTQQVELAVQYIKRAVVIYPNDAQAFMHLANAYTNLKQHERALDCLQKAIAINPSHAEAHYLAGIALRALQNNEQALGYFQQAIQLRPDYAEAHYSEGNARYALKQITQAKASFESAIQYRPSFVEAHLNLGACDKELGLPEQALQHYERVLALNPNYVDAYINRGVAFMVLQRIPEALVSFDKAIALSPQRADALWNKAFCLLLDGQLYEGFALYEWRWRTPRAGMVARPFTQPLWTGEQDLLGMTILLDAEQGLGDVLQFCRYVPQVAALGAKVILHVQASLADLLHDLTGVHQLIVRGQAIPKFDYHCPLLSLPLAFKINMQSITAQVPYLQASSDKIKQWRARLGKTRKKRIGLVWSGNPEPDALRSVPLAELVALLPESYEYISLQKEVWSRDVEALERSAIRHFGDEIIDFSDTAALSMLVDAVITIDTSVAHLVGALARPTYLMLPQAPDWRWFLKRSDSPWYHSIKIYRQEQHKAWGTVLLRILNDLQNENHLNHYKH
jgi:tetratricopeptide (TPR) repeat protein